MSTSNPQSIPICTLQQNGMLLINSCFLDLTESFFNRLMTSSDHVWSNSQVNNTRNKQHPATRFQRGDDVKTSVITLQVCKIVPILFQYGINEVASIANDELRELAEFKQGRNNGHNEDLQARPSMHNFSNGQNLPLTAQS